MSTKNGIIGLDFHGVITSNPEYFREFTIAAVKHGYDIHIISGASVKTIEVYAEKYGLVYQKIFSILDFYEDKKQVNFLPDGGFHVDEKLWNKAKADYCNQHHIDLLIDDSLFYKEGYNGFFCHYDRKHHCCFLTPEVILDFKLDPQKLVEYISDILK